MTCLYLCQLFYYLFSWFIEKLYVIYIIFFKIWFFIFKVNSPGIILYVIWGEALLWLFNKNNQSRNHLFSSHSVTCQVSLYTWVCSRHSLILFYISILALLKCQAVLITVFLSESEYLVEIVLPLCSSQLSWLFLASWLPYKLQNECLQFHTHIHAHARTNTSVVFWWEWNL